MSLTDFLCWGGGAQDTPFFGPVVIPQPRAVGQIVYPPEPLKGKGGNPE